MRASSTASRARTFASARSRSAIPGKRCSCCAPHRRVATASRRWDVGTRKSAWRPDLISGATHQGNAPGPSATMARERGSARRSSRTRAKPSCQIAIARRGGRRLVPPSAHPSTDAGTRRRRRSDAARVRGRHASRGCIAAGPICRRARATAWSSQPEGRRRATVCARARRAVPSLLAHDAEHEIERTVFPAAQGRSTIEVFPT